jgi:cell division protein FtsB
MSRDKATQIEVLSSEIEEIEANIESVAARIAKLPDGDVRRQFEQDKADFERELSERRAQLAALQSAP